MTLKNNRAPLLSNIKLCASLPYVNSNWSYGPETAKWGHDLCDLDLWPRTFCMDITSVNGNISGKFQDDTITGTLSKKAWQTDRQTDGQTDRQTEISVHRVAWSQLKITKSSEPPLGPFVVNNEITKFTQFVTNKHVVSAKEPPF